MIKVNNLTKIYKLYDSPKDRFKEALNPFGKKYHHDFYALKNISFEVKKGETVGIIGKNGSGKSTLLKILTGVLTPTSGSYCVNGKVSSLLELGTGFNPELTGVENVYFNATLLGYTKEEIDKKLDDILSFADIGEFVHQPVKTYSSGMYVRLAFAVAINVDPEVLIVDEALAVGDAAFQMKCIDRINKMIENGVTLLFVSHDPGAVKRLCKRAILLEKGNMIKVGNPEEVFDLYNAMLADENLSNTVVKELDTGHVQTISGTGEAKVTNVEILNSKGMPETVFEVGEPVAMKIDVSVNNDLPRLVLGFMIKDRLGQVMFGTNTYHTKQIIEQAKKGEKYVFLITFNMNLGVGDYSVSTALVSSDTHLEDNYEWKDYAMIFKVVNVHNNIFIGLNWLPVNIDIVK